LTVNVIFYFSFLSFLTSFSLLGCLSTGKEANVYYARGKNDREYAVKIFKTSILVFKDRDKYVSGEFRFRNGYCKSNPRKMVKTWAEKEMRNLKRLYSMNIMVPMPFLLKSHVLIMEFLGNNGWCAPRLKDATLTMDELYQCYQKICLDMRIMYQDCNLVHGDLSEYNLLWFEGSVRVIDVSQSVEQAHPFAIEFLRKDVSNITEFFAKKGLHVLTKLELFQFIQDKAPINPLLNTYYESPADFVNLPEYQEYSKKLHQKFDEFMEESQRKEERSAQIGSSFKETEKDSDNPHHDNQQAEEEKQLEKANKQMVDEAVFLNSYIPTRLSEIANPYKEMEMLQKGGREMIFANAMKNMISTGEKKVEETNENDEGKNEEDDESSSEEEEEGDAELKALIAKLTTPGKGLTNGESPAEEQQQPEKQKKKESTSNKKKVKKTQEEEDNDTPVTEDKEVPEVNSEDEEGDNDDDNSSDDDDEESDDEDGDDTLTASGKYRRTLPSRDNTLERNKEKEARKEARKAMKEAKSEKRKNKVPKHVKKRAMKVGKK
jgi:RIO kinase 1